MLEKLATLTGELIPPGTVKLKGEKDAYRLRVREYRILYKVLWKERVVLIFKIEHRKKAYKKP